MPYGTQSAVPAYTEAGYQRVQQNMKYDQLIQVYFTTKNIFILFK